MVGWENRQIDLLRESIRVGRADEILPQRTSARERVLVTARIVEVLLESGGRLSDEMTLQSTSKFPCDLEEHIREAVMTLSVDLTQP